jgi:hypothetical protein
MMILTQLMPLLLYLLTLAIVGALFDPQLADACARKRSVLVGALRNADQPAVVE